MLQNIIVFALVFGIIVVVHEFGHFYFAKRAGILVREFAIGFGPKIFHYRKGETTYTVRLLPLGGYVLMAGYEEEADLRPGMPATLVLDEKDEVVKIDLQNKEQQVQGVPIEVTNFNLDDELFIAGRIAQDADQPERYTVKRDALLVKKDGTELQIAPIDRRFQSAPLLSRMMTNFAGPMNNFILAVITFILLAFLQGGVPSNEPRIGEIEEGTPAAAAQLEEGDLVRSVNGVETPTWQDMTVIIQQHPDEEVLLEIEKEDGTIVEETIVPEAQEIDEETTVGRIGVQVYFEHSFLSMIAYGFTETWTVMTAIFSFLASIFTGGFSMNQIGGPVAIYATTEAVVQTGGFLGVISFIGMLSANLGLMNLLPIPALDGGKLVLNVIEGIRGKPISEEKEGIITLIGAAFLITLMIIVTWSDIRQYFF
jgi:regulator of sigma E protease